MGTIQGVSRGKNETRQLENKIFVSFENNNRVNKVGWNAAMGMVNGMCNTPSRSISSVWNKITAK